MTDGDAEEVSWISAKRSRYAELLGPLFDLRSIGIHLALVPPIAYIFRQLGIDVWRAPVVIKMAYCVQLLLLEARHSPST